MKIGRNEPCPCRSGKKYKNCCLRKSSLGYRLHMKGRNAEDFVYQLSQKSFFTDWCYQNPKLPNGKEICDLLVVYENTAIIWQIKDLKLDENRKYKKSEVAKNLQQLSTARRRLFELSIPIELENPRRGEEQFNPELISEIYSISALLGKGEDYFSLAKIVNGRVIHTFTRQFTEIVLTELDTIKDFVQYLREKESMISSGISVTLLGGEQELLAYYLGNQRTFEKLKEMNMAIFEEGLWSELKKRPEYIAKKKEDRISYGWDSMINVAHTCRGDYEKVAREMARLSRFERRVMSKAFYDAHVKAHKQKHQNTFRRLVKSKGTSYCFLFYDDVEPRRRRRAMLGAMCYIARGMYQDNCKVVGIATEMKMRPECSYDFCFIDIPKWTENEQKEMERLQNETGIFTSYKERRAHEDEYPVAD